MTEPDPLPEPTAPPSGTPLVAVNPRAATPTPDEYPAGSVKQDPESQAVAVRTIILDPENRKDWGVMSLDRGGQYATWDQVATWPDLVVAEVPE
jgi:hypothetical protein